MIYSEIIWFIYHAKLTETMLKPLMVLLKKFGICIRFQQTEMSSTTCIEKESEEKAQQT